MRYHDRRIFLFQEQAGLAHDDKSRPNIQGAALVDTTRYAADVRVTYERLFITDSPNSMNGPDLAAGAYGFGGMATLRNLDQ